MHNSAIETLAKSLAEAQLQMEKLDGLKKTCERQYDNIEFQREEVAERIECLEKAIEDLTVPDEE